MKFQYDLDSIEVYDDFFEESTRDQIFKYLQRPKWSLTGGNAMNAFWHMDDLENEEYFSIYLFNKISQKMGDKIKNHSINRIYANGQTGGQCGNPHSDDGDYTLLYYPNPKWDIGWQGHLIFVDLDWNPDKVVAYKPNRMVCFPSNTVHYADAPTRLFSGLRTSLAYKLIAPKND
jgi:hypothetical protein|tara:strand:- start:107 stop:631 length:525 start_codon:yes stop_codon:yes gene_type:complete